MRCNDLYNKILNIYDNGYIQKNIITRCSTASDGDFFVINDNKKKVSLAVSFDNSYKKNEEIYAEFIKVDRMIAWNLKMCEVNSDEKKLALLQKVWVEPKIILRHDSIFFKGEFAADEVNHGLEELSVPESPCSAFYVLNDAVHSLQNGIRVVTVKVVQDFSEMIFD